MAVGVAYGMNWDRVRKRVYNAQFERLFSISLLDIQIHSVMNVPKLSLVPLFEFFEFVSRKNL